MSAAAWDGDWQSVSAPPRSVPRRWFDLAAAAATDECCSLLVVLRTLLLSLEAVVVACVAAASPCFFYFYRLEDGQIMAYRQNWSMLAVLLVFPLTMTLSSAFSRREAALVQLSLLKANLLATFVAHRDWDWWTIPKDPLQAPVSGREQRLPGRHVQHALAEIRGISSTMRTFLLAPMCSRVRHFYTEAGRQERRTIMALTRSLTEQLTWRFHTLSQLVEEMKAAGLPANEATRIRQHFVNAMTAVQQLRALKQYRTPLGLRAYSRFFILIMPGLLGPYYADLALATTLAFSIVVSVAIAMALQGLFHLRYEMEDPFTSTTHVGDTVDVVRELGEFEADLDIFNSTGVSNANSTVGSTPRWQQPQQQQEPQPQQRPLQQPQQAQEQLHQHLQQLEEQQQQQQDSRHAQAPAASFKRELGRTSAELQQQQGKLQQQEAAVSRQAAALEETASAGTL